MGHLQVLSNKVHPSGQGRLRKPWPSSSPGSCPGPIKPEQASSLVRPEHVTAIGTLQTGPAHACCFANCANVRGLGAALFGDGPCLLSSCADMRPSSELANPYERRPVREMRCPPSRSSGRRDPETVFLSSEKQPGAKPSRSTRGGVCTHTACCQQMFSGSSCRAFLLAAKVLKVRGLRNMCALTAWGNMLKRSW